MEFISRNAEKSNEIYRTFSEEEREFVTGGDTRDWYVKQEEYDGKTLGKVIYSSLCIEDNEPISFLDVFVINNIGEITLGVKKNKRGYGYASMEVKRMLDWYKENKDNGWIKSLSWFTHSKNKDSIRLAEKFNFTRDYERDYDEEWIAYRV